MKSILACLTVALMSIILVSGCSRRSYRAELIPLKGSYDIRSEAFLEAEIDYPCMQTIDGTKCVVRPVETDIERSTYE